MNIYKFESKFIVYEAGKYIFQLNKLIMYISRYIDFDTIDTDKLIDSLLDILYFNLYEHVPTCVITHVSIHPDNVDTKNIEDWLYVNEDLNIIDLKLIDEDYIQKIYRFFKQEFHTIFEFGKP